MINLNQKMNNQQLIDYPKGFRLGVGHEEKQMRSSKGKQDFARQSGTES